MANPARQRQLAPLREQQKAHRRRKYSKKIIRDALIASNGILSRAAKQLGCSRSTITDWLDKHPDLDRELQDIKESYVDLAEGSLLTQVAEKNTQATIFLLRSLGRKRGWVDSPTEHIHALAEKGSGTWLDIMKRAMTSGELADSNKVVIDMPASAVKACLPMGNGQDQDED